MTRVAPTLLLLAACTDAPGEGVPNVADTAMCMQYPPLLSAETPPLPGDPCADPPSPVSAGIEAAVRVQQGQADATRDALFADDVVTVVTCGTGSPIPSDRAQACVAVFAKGQFLLFDAGDGAAPSLEDLGLPVPDLTAIFLTHFHSDHMADLGEVVSRSWILGRTTSVDVYGGPGLQRIVDGFNLVYTPDEQYRRDHHGEDVFLPSATLPATARPIDGLTPDGIVVYDVGGVVVRAFQVDHAPVSPSLGFRVEVDGHAVGISGDTIDTPGLRALADGVDLLVSEAIDPAFALDTSCALERAGDDRNAQILRDIRTYHIDVADLAGVVTEAGVGTVVLTHLVPAVAAAQAEARFAAPIEATFGGDVVVAEDGSQFTVPLD